MSSSDDCCEIVENFQPRARPESTALCPNHQQADVERRRGEPSRLTAADETASPDKFSANLAATNAWRPSLQVSTSPSSATTQILAFGQGIQHQDLAREEPQKHDSDHAPTPPNPFASFAFGGGTAPATQFSRAKRKVVGDNGAGKKTLGIAVDNAEMIFKRARQSKGMLKFDRCAFVYQYHASCVSRFMICATPRDNAIR